MDKKVNQGFLGFPRTLGSRKKAVSLMVAYVLLISMAIALSILIFAWLRYYVTPGEQTSCPSDVSLIVNEYSYDGSNLNLTLENKGFFSIDGFVIRGSDNLEGLAITPLYDNAGRYYFSTPLEPGQSHEHIFSTSALSDLKKLDIQPFIIEDKKDVFCQAVVIKNIYKNAEAPVCDCSLEEIGGCGELGCPATQKLFNYTNCAASCADYGNTVCLDDRSCECDITLSGGTSIKTVITEYISPAQAYDNYVICIEAGSYTESNLGATGIFKDKHGLTLRGIHGKPKINLNNLAPSSLGLFITSNYTTLENLELYNSNSHLVSVRSETGAMLSNFRFIDNIVYDAVADGLHLENVYGVEIKDNQIYNVGGNGFYASKADKVVVKDNLIYNIGDWTAMSGDGIVLTSSPNSEIINNLVYGIGNDGIKVVYRSNYTIMYNTVYQVNDTAFTIRSTKNASVKYNKAWWGIDVTTKTNRNGAFYIDDMNTGLELYCNYINASDLNGGNLPAGIGINKGAANEINISHNYIDEGIIYNNDGLSSFNLGEDGPIVFSAKNLPYGIFVFENNYCKDADCYCVDGDAKPYTCCSSSAVGKYDEWKGICGDVGSSL